MSCTEDQAKHDYDTSIDVLLTCFTYLEIGQPRYLRVTSISTTLTYLLRRMVLLRSDPIFIGILYCFQWRSVFLNVSRDH